MDSSSDSEGAEEQPATCEVCGSDAATVVMLRCRYFGDRHQVGCHTYCLAGIGVKRKGREEQEEYQCLACLDYSRCARDAAQRERAGAGHGTPEEMPALRRVVPEPRVRHGHQAIAHATEQQKIDRSAAAAAAKAARRASDFADDDADDKQGPRKRRRTEDEAEVAPGLHARQPAGLGPGGLPASRKGAVAAAAAAAGGGPDADAVRGGRKRRPPTEKFVKGLNKGNNANVRMSQERVRAQKAAAAAAAAGASGGGTAGRGRGRGSGAAAQHAAADEHDPAAAADDFFYEDDMLSDEAAADAASPQGLSRQQQQRRQQRQRQPAAALASPPGRARVQRPLGLHVSPAEYGTKLMKAILHCRLVVQPTGQDEQHQQGRRRTAWQQQQATDPDNYLHVMGTFWSSEDIAALADEDQQEEYNDLLTELENEHKAQRKLELMGGAFDLATHPSVQRFCEDPNIHYKPLLFIPHLDPGKRMVQELLGEPRRFAVMSVQSKLLVLLPSSTGSLIAICPKENAAADILTQEVIKTIMGHPKLGCPSTQNTKNGNQGACSESLLGPPDAPDDMEVDTKEGILPPRPRHRLQQQQEQQQHPQQQQQEEDHEGSLGAAAEAGDSDLGSSREQPQESVNLGLQQQVQHRQLLEVRQLPEAMRTASRDQQQQQQHCGEMHLMATSAGTALRLEIHGAQQGTGTAATALPLVNGVSRPVVAAPAGVAAAGRLATNSSDMSACAELVQSCSLAQVLQQAQAGAVASQEQQQARAALSEEQQAEGPQKLTLQSFMPQLADLAEVQHLRLFLVGFRPEMLDAGGSLSQPLDAARKLVDGVYTSPHALQDLLEDLRLIPSAAAAAQLGSPYFSLPNTQPLSASTLALPAAAAAASGGGVSQSRGFVHTEQSPAPQLDLTEGPRDKIYRVLLVPDLFDSQALQQQLGDVPLWRFLAAPVAVFKQGAGSGPLMQLRQLAQQQRQQRPHGANGAAAAGAGAAARAGLQFSGDATAGLRLPDKAAKFQMYSDGLAVVADKAVLKHCGADELQQLLQLLRQVRQLLVGQGPGDASAAAVGDADGAYLAVTQHDLEALPNELQELLQQGCRESSVLLLDDLLAPASLAAAAAASTLDRVVTAATHLAAAPQQHLRHVLVISPDPADAIVSQPQSPLSSGALAAARVATDAVASLVAAAAAPAKASSGGAQQQMRSTSKGSKGGGPGQRLADTDSDAVKAIAIVRLTAGAKDPRLITGTFSQLLQFLACIVANSSRDSKEGGEAAAAAAAGAAMELQTAPSAAQVAESISQGQGQSAGGVRSAKG